MNEEKRKEIVDALENTIQILCENAGEDAERATAAKNLGNIELSTAYMQCSKQALLMADYLRIDCNHIISQPKV